MKRILLSLTLISGLATLSLPLGAMKIVASDDPIENLHREQTSYRSFLKNAQMEGDKDKIRHWKMKLKEVAARLRTARKTMKM